MSSKKSYRSKKGGKGSRFLQIEHYIFRLASWQSLKPTEVRIWLLLAQRYNGANNGRISLSIREASKLGRMSAGTAQKALRTLIAKGFVRCRYKGSFSQKTSYASEYELTHLKHGVKSPTREFASWKPNENAVSKQTRRGINLGAMTNKSVL